MARRGEFDLGSVPGVPEIAAGAATYSARMGLTRPTASSLANAVINPDHAREIARQYEAAPIFDPAAVPSYRAMAEETRRQFEFLTASRKHGGLGIDVDVTRDDPYGAAGPEYGDKPWTAVMRQMRADVTENRRLRVLSTKTTGAHPVFSDEENDQFRAVHDVFGHLASGRGIDPHGEEAAFRSHFSMFTPRARPAMATETRGQNATLNFGSNPGTFAEQKIALLPAAQTFRPIGRRSQMMSAATMARSFNERQFGSLSFRKLR